MAWTRDQPPEHSLPCPDAYLSPNVDARSPPYTYAFSSGALVDNNGQQSPSFQYERLNYDDDEIRLLQVKLENDIEYELVSHVSLRKSKPQYTALSYTWGDQASQQTITINGMSKLVSSNLYQALREVRTFWKATYAEHGKQLVLWGDQLCINQANDEEKNHQVAFMRMIYDRAEEVLVWLPIKPPFSSFDPAKGRTGCYNSSLPKFSDWNAYKSWLARNLSVQPSSESPSNEGYERQSPLIYGKGSDSPHPTASNRIRHDDNIGAWADICAILQSPWWRRAWVYQEFVFATRATFLIDGYSVPWRELYETLSDLMSHFEDHTAFWEGERDNIENRITERNSRLDQSRRHYASVLEHQTDDGDCCIYCGDSCAILQRRSSHLLEYNNKMVQRYFDFNRIASLTEDVEDVEAVLWLFASCTFMFWLVSLVFLFAYYLISGLLGGICYIVSNRKWDCGHKRQSTIDQESAQQQLHDLEEGLTNEWTDPVASRQAVELHCTRLAEAHEAWELTKFFFTSKTDIATAFLPLSRLVKFSRNSHCTDHRDKIFAFLSLTDASYDLQASYGEQNTVQKVLVEAIRAIITVEKSINILSLASEDRDVRNNDLRSLPSWVPWLSLPEDRSSEHNRFLRDVKFPLEQCNASKDQACVTSFLAKSEKASEDVLKVRGIRVDTLSRVVEDPPRQVWRRFDGNSVFQFTTRHTARPGDEIWVLFGLDMPVALSRPSKRDNFYTVIGPAMVQEDGEMSDVMTGSLIDKLEQGRVSTEDICII